MAASTGPAGPIWDALPIVSKIQFPWRLTAVLTLLCVGIVARLEPRRAGVAVLLALALFVPFANWDRTAPRAAFDSEQPQSEPPGTVFPNPRTAWEAGSGGWYWRHHTLAEIWLIPKNTGESFFANLAGEYPPEYDLIRYRPAVLVDDSSSSIRVLEWGQTHRKIEIDAAVGGTLMWRVVSFPDMRVTVDGREVPLALDSPTGLVTCPAPVGQHRVEWYWRPFPSLQWARRVSSMAALLVIVGLLSALRAGGGWVLIFRR